MPEPKPESADTLLVRAGGIARRSAKTDPATTGELVARSFRHPAMAERVVVRLVEESLDSALTAEMSVLGFTDAGEKIPVGRTRKRALGFPAWALVHHPTKARFALEVMKEFRKAGTRAKTKPGHARDAFAEIATKLERSVPAFLPSYWEEVGRVFVAEDATTFASQCFEKARTAEREYKLPVDEDRRAAAYLEFTAVGAVPAKSLAGYADDLVKAFGAVEGERRFLELAVQRIRAGIPPWTGMAKELAKLAKAAKRGPEAEASFLKEILSSPALKKAPPDFWAAYRPKLLELARASRDVLHRVLWLFPEPRGFAKFLPSWLELLADLGATEAVARLEGAGEAARWLSALTRFVTFSDEWGDREERLPELYFELFAQLAPALGALGEPLDLASYQRWGDDGTYSPDVLEAALELGLPLAPPKGESPDVALGDMFWKDPVLLAAHPEYGKLLASAVAQQFGRPDFETRAKGKVGLVEARRAHLASLVAQLTQGALPQLKSSLETLTESTSGATFLEFPDAAVALDRVQVGAALGRTLRGGVFDELTWPEFEAALARLSGPKDEIELHGTRQHPILRSGRKVVVFEGKRHLKDLDLPTIAKEASAIAYLDGDLLVGFYDSAASEARAVWARHAKTPFASQLRLRGIAEAVGVEGGGVTLGGACLHAGDTPTKIEAQAFASDGKGYWQGRIEWHDRLKLTEYDPKTGKTGRASWPDFVREASEKDDGLTLLEVRLMPLPGCASSLLGEKGGLVGHYVRRSKSGAFEIVRIDGKTRRGSFKPDALVDWPGTGDLRALSVSRAWSDTESDDFSIYGPTTGEAGEAADEAPTGAFGNDEWPTAGFKLLPREYWLHYLGPRDEESSRALRAVTDEAAAALLLGAMEDDADDEALTHALAAVKAHLPGVKNEVIQRGVAKIAKIAAERAHELAALQDRGKAESGGVPDDDLVEALPLLPTDGWEDGFCTTDMAVVADAFLDQKRGKLTCSRVSWHLQVEHLVKLAGFASTRSATGESERKTLRDLLVALRDCRLLGQTVTRAELAVKTGSSFLTRPKGKDTWLASAGEALLYARMPDEDEDEPTQKVFVLAAGDKFPLPADATLTSKETVTIPDDRAFIDDLLAKLDADGAAPHDPTALALVTGETSLTAAEVALVLAGLPKFGQYQHDFLGKELRATLDLKVTDAARAKEKLRALPDDQLLALVAGAANVREATGYWAPASDETSVPRALVRTAKALFGKSVTLREELVARVDKECRTELGARKALTLLLTATDPENPLLVPRPSPVPWDAMGHSGSFFCADVVATAAMLIPYLATTLPVGDPYVQAVPALYQAVTRVLDLPDFLLPLGDRYEEEAKKRASLLDQVGGKKISVSGRNTEREGRDNGFVVAVDDAAEDGVAFAVRTASVRARRADLLPYLSPADDDDLYGVEGAKGAYYLLSKECEELVARIAKSPVPEGSYEANPLLSAKATVEKLRDAAGLDDDAAALYLQMLALPDPKKKSLLAFNGWKTAHYDKAAAALVKKKLLVEGKRERAGRDVFLPGGWERATAIETYKLPLYDRVSFDRPTMTSAPHALYARAFERWASGDKPGFEDVTKRKK